MCIVGEPVNFAVYTETTVFEQLKPEWNILLKRSQSDQIFSTWEWQSTWWNVYCPGELWVVVCRDEDGQLLGIAPWFIDESGIVRLIGSGDVTDYVDVIVDSDHVDEVLHCFATCLVEQSASYKLLELFDVPESSVTLENLPAILERCGFSVIVEQSEVCPIIRLPQEWAGYYQLLDKKQRHEVRRKVRRANGTNETIDWYIVDSSHDLDAEIRRFLSLMAASDEEKLEFVQNPKHEAFFWQLIPVMFEKEWLQLNFLTINGEATAAYFNFVYNNQILVYNSGLSHDKYAHLSPGILLLVHNIRYAIDNGFDVFDFLRGDETYKYRMGGKDTPVYKLIGQPKQQ